MTMLPVLYQYSGFGSRAPRDDQQRFINTPESLLELLGTLRAARPEAAALRYGVAPHSLRAVSAESLRTLLGGIDELRRRCISISPNKPPKSTRASKPKARVRCNGCWIVSMSTPLVPRARDACRRERNAALAKSGAVAGLCLTTEANLGDGIFPAQEYLDAQGRIGVGSDSHIGVDWRAELRLLEYGQRLTRRQRNVLASAQATHVADRLFDAALEGGAHATGRAVGALAGGPSRRLAGARRESFEHRRACARTPGSQALCSASTAKRRSRRLCGRRPGRDNRRHRDEEGAYARYRVALADLLK